ncbi:MAG TPA: hypothetical protein VFD20_00470 [Demequina sp.]|nr:hypothetical protein [Demequina sp.]
MNDPTESEEQFEEETLALEEIADETEHEREPHDENAVDEVPEGQQQIEPLKGPHHTPSKE